MYTLNSFLIDLTNELSKIIYPEQMKDYLLEIFTPEELNRMCVRREIIRLLKRNVPQYKIAGLAGVGIGTVTRMSLHLKRKERLKLKGAGEGT